MMLMAIGCFDLLDRFTTTDDTNTIQLILLLPLQTASVHS